MGFESMRRAMNESLMAQSDALRAMLDECESSGESLGEEESRKKALRLGCGIAPWAYNSALRVQTLGIIGAEKRKKRFRFNPDDITQEEREEERRRSQKLKTAGGPDGTASTLLEILNGLCTK